MNSQSCASVITTVNFRVLPSPQKETLYPQQWLPTSLDPQPQATMNCLLWTFHINGLICGPWRLAFPRSIMFSRLIHMVAWLVLHSFLTLDDPPLSVELLDCFHFLVVVTDAAMNFQKRFCADVCFSFSWAATCEWNC